MYAFLFDKKSLALVALGFCLGALLFFGAGLAVGLHLDEPKDKVQWTLLAQEARVQPLLPKQADPLASPSTAADPPSTERSAAQGPEATEPPALPPESAEPTSTPTPQSQDTAPSLPNVSGQASSVEPMPASKSGPAPKTEVARTTETTPPATDEPVALSSVASNPIPHGGYVVQVGTFTYPKNAERRREDMESYGYRAYVQDGRNSKGHPFYAVRIGHYPELGVAREVATVIRRQLGLSPNDRSSVNVLQLPQE